jgi:hypothetical protein
MVDKSSRVTVVNLKSSTVDVPNIPKYAQSFNNTDVSSTKLDKTTATSKKRNMILQESAAKSAKRGDKTPLTKSTEFKGKSKISALHTQLQSTHERKKQVLN